MREDACYAFTGLDVYEVDDRLSLALAAPLRDVPDAYLIYSSAVRDEEHIFVRRRGNELVDRVFFFCRHTDHAFASALLHLKGAARYPLDVAGLTHGDDCLFVGDELFVAKLTYFAFEHLRLSVIAVFFFEAGELVLDYSENLLRVGE